jgi:hypothetical protein
MEKNIQEEKDENSGKEFIIENKSEENQNEMFRGEKENNKIDIITSNNINNLCSNNSIINYQSGNNNSGIYPTFEKKILMKILVSITYI